QRLGVHPGLCHVGAKRVTAYVRRNLGHLHLVYAVVLGADVLEVLFPVESHHWTPVLVEKEKSAVPLHYRLHLWRFPVGKYTGKALLYLRRHGNHSGAAAGFRVFYHVL